MRTIGRKGVLEDLSAADEGSRHSLAWFLLDGAVWSERWDELLRVDPRAFSPFSDSIATLGDDALVTIAAANPPFQIARVLRNLAYGALGASDAAVDVLTTRVEEGLDEFAALPPPSPSRFSYEVSTAENARRVEVRLDARIAMLANVLTPHALSRAAELGRGHPRVRRVLADGLVDVPASGPAEPRWTLAQRPLPADTRVVVGRLVAGSRLGYLELADADVPGGFSFFAWPGRGCVYDERTLAEVMEARGKSRQEVALHNVAVRLGGRPPWLSSPDPVRCSCGRLMDYVGALERESTVGLQHWGSWGKGDERRGRVFGFRCVCGGRAEISQGKWSESLRGRHPSMSFARALGLKSPSTIFPVPDADWYDAAIGRDGLPFAELRGASEGARRSLARYLLRRKDQGGTFDGRWEELVRSYPSAFAPYRDAIVSRDDERLRDDLAHRRWPDLDVIVSGASDGAVDRLVELLTRSLDEIRTLSPFEGRAQGDVLERARARARMLVNIGTPYALSRGADLARREELVADAFRDALLEVPPEGPAIRRWTDEVHDIYGGGRMDDGDPPGGHPHLRVGQLSTPAGPVVSLEIDAAIVDGGWTFWALSVPTCEVTDEAALTAALRETRAHYPPEEEPRAIEVPLWIDGYPDGAWWNPPERLGRLGGRPEWLQNPAAPTCSCGRAPEYVGYVSAGMIWKDAMDGWLYGFRCGCGRRWQVFQH